MIYDYEIQYKANADGQLVGEYVSKSTLRLPVYCMNCLPFQASLEGSDAAFLPQQAVNQLGAYRTATFGPEILKNSTLCIN